MSGVRSAVTESKASVQHTHICHSLVLMSDTTAFCMEKPLVYNRSRVSSVDLINLITAVIGGFRMHSWFSWMHVKNLGTGPPRKNTSWAEPSKKRDPCDSPFPLSSSAPPFQACLKLLCPGGSCVFLFFRGYQRALQVPFLHS